MSDISTTTLAGGCFWCLEAVFAELRGVSRVESGYMGGHVASPSYEAVCTGTTGHAEIVQIDFDPTVISFRDLLDVFFTIHDPTQLDRQGNDVGPQYRSAIFVHDDEQRRVAEATVRELEAEHRYDDPIVTRIDAASTFWPAGDYHREYFARNGAQPYCAFVVAPKVAKARKHFSEKLRRA